MDEGSRTLSSPVLLGGILILKTCWQVLSPDLVKGPWQKTEDEIITKVP
jgi:hypothetical protein